MNIRFADRQDWNDWLRMSQALWPDCPPDKRQQEMVHILLEAETQAILVCESNEKKLIGFLEASLRDQAEGCETSPVGYIEGWYVDPEARRQGVGASLVAAAERWAVSKGCREMASDCLIDNDVSLAAHLSLGYAEVERVILFRKSLE